MAYNNCNQQRNCYIFKQGPEGGAATNEFISVATEVPVILSNTFQSVNFDTIVDQGGRDAQLFPTDPNIYLSGGHVYLVTFTARVQALVDVEAAFSALIALNGSPLSYSIAGQSSSFVNTFTIELANEILVPVSIGSTIQLQLRSEVLESLQLINATVSVVAII